MHKPLIKSLLLLPSNRWCITVAPASPMLGLIEVSMLVNHTVWDLTVLCCQLVIDVCVGGFHNCLSVLTSAFSGWTLLDDYSGSWKNGDCFFWFLFIHHTLTKRLWSPCLDWFHPLLFRVLFFCSPFLAFRKLMLAHLNAGRSIAH